MRIQSFGIGSLRTGHVVRCTYSKRELRTLRAGAQQAEPVIVRGSVRQVDLARAESSDSITIYRRGVGKISLLYLSAYLLAKK